LGTLPSGAIVALSDASWQGCGQWTSVSRPRSRGGSSATRRCSLD